MKERKYLNKKMSLIHARHAVELINFTEVVAAVEEELGGDSKGGGKMREVVVEDGLQVEEETETGVTAFGKFL